MPRHTSVFRTFEGAARYEASYDAALELWPVPFESLVVPTRLGTTHVIASGQPDAPPLVLLHMAAVSSTMWFPNVAALSRTYRVYAVDTLGDLGKSVPSRPRGNRSASAEWLLDALDALGVSEANLAGASYGGWLALNLALHAPERVRRLALLAPAGSFALLSLKFGLTMAPALLFPSEPVVRKAT